MMSRKKMIFLETRPERRKRAITACFFSAFHCALFLLAWMPRIADAQQFEARVDRRAMAQNETLTLDVVYAERADTSSIDFEEMLPDFSILSNRPSSQTRFVNLKRSSQTSWQLTLMPKRIGRLTIPSFSIGSVRTQPIEVVVSPAPKSPEEGAPFSARLVLDRERAFVGEQILIRIMLSAARGVGELRGSPLEISGMQAALVNQSEFQRVIENTPYQVTELSYVFFPEAPGMLTIPSLQYTGTMRGAQLVVARTEPVAIEILDPALDAEASLERPWLPAEAVALASEWSGEVDSLAVGEPVTRTIQIAAAGQRAAAISPIAHPDGPYKQYSEQPLLEDAETSTGILGRRTESIVLVPTQEGDFTLPPIEIKWWNTAERRWQIARLREETLRIGPAPTTAALPPLLPSEPVDTVEPTSASLEARDPDRVTIGLGVLSAVLFLCCIALVVRVRRLERETGHHRVALGTDAFENSTKERAAFNLMLRSLGKRVPSEARREILAWARLNWPYDRITRLEQIARKSPDEALKQMLAALDAQLYGSDADPSQHGPSEGEGRALDYQELKKLLTTLREQVTADDTGAPSTLDELYPSQTG
jgi:BatD DUF11 like domain